MGNLPDGWSSVPLGGIGEWFGGGTPAKSNPNFWTDGTIPWVSPKDMKTDRIGVTTDYITDLAIKGSSARVVAGSSILIVTRSGILRHSLPVAVTTREVAFNQDLKAVTLFPWIDPEYVVYHLKADAKKILDACAKAGTTVESLDFKRLKAYPLRLAPYSEQIRIVKMLDAHIGRTVHANNNLMQIPELIEKCKFSILKLAYSGQLTKEFRGEFSSGTVDTNRSPESWTVKPLSEISEIQSGIQVGKKRSLGSELVEVPYLRVANVQRGWLNLDEVKTIAVTSSEKERLLLKAGDILMNEGGDRDKLGRGWIWNEQICECIHQNHVFRIRLKDSCLPPEFVSHYANAMGQQYFADQGTQTTNLASISKRKLSALPVPIPPSDEAIAIVDLIDAAFTWFDRIILEQTSAANLLPQLNAAILSKAFRGEFLPQNPSDKAIKESCEYIPSQNPTVGLLKNLVTSREREFSWRDVLGYKNLERPPSFARTTSWRAVEAIESPDDLQVEYNLTATVRKRKVGQSMTKSLVEVLEDTKDWVSAQELFAQCGIAEGSQTIEIEEIYSQLRALDKTGRLEIRSIHDKDGRKQYDQLKLKAA